MSTETPDRHGTVLRRSEFAGRGAAIQLLGLVAPVIGWALLGVIGATVGALVLLILLIVGSVQSRVHLCSECRNQVRARSVRVCPACGAKLRPGYD